MERYLRVNLLGPGPRLIKKEFTGPRSHKGWETLVYWIHRVHLLVESCKTYFTFLVVFQLDAQIPFNIIIYSSLHVSSMSCSSSGETDCIDTVYTQAAHDTATNTEWHLPEAVSIQFTPNQHTTQPPTRSDIYQKLYRYNLFLLMMSMTCSKHVENYK